MHVVSAQSYRGKRGPLLVPSSKGANGQRLDKCLQTEREGDDSSPGGLVNDELSPRVVGYPLKIDDSDERAQTYIMKGRHAEVGGCMGLQRIKKHEPPRVGDQDTRRHLRTNQRVNPSIAKRRRTLYMGHGV